VNKRTIIIAAAAGLVSFAGAFVAGWFTGPKAVAAGPDQTEAPGQTHPPAPGAPALLAPNATATAESAALSVSERDGTGTRTLTEQQLKDLILEVRDKIQQYDRKLQDLEKEKERLQIARQTLKKDIDTLNNLRVDLAASVASLKSERDALLKARTEVEQVEKTNLMAIAAAYDRMDAARAGEILKTMALGRPQDGVPAQKANADDALKILHFMQERTKAKVLAEMAGTDPGLAATLSQRLKQVMEKK
jgi:flagellar motility protein MotE (MotC chaperone)